MNDKNLSPAVEESTAPKKKHRKKKKNKFLLVIQKLFAVIMTTLLSLFLVMVITGTIVATALTVYVLDFMDETTGITIQEMEMSCNSYVYGTDSEGELVELHKVSNDLQRIPITIDEIPQHVRDAFVYTEDERFYTHDGVDYKRTFTAFLNMFIHIYNTEQGGSTITQQLIKNLTGDNETSPQRKIREIFRAMQLEKKYSKDEILETYLNYIGFGGPINGIQLASVQYFGKDVKDLSVAEAATLAAIPKSPNYFGPYVYEVNEETGEILDGKINNKERQQYVLWQMYKNGALTYDEYQKYLDEKLIYTDSEEYKKLHPENLEIKEDEEDEKPSWIVDAAINELCGIIQEMYNIDYNEALRRFNTGGYQIYTTADMEFQDYLDEKFLDLNNLMNRSSVIRYVDLDGDGEYEEDTPQVGFAALNYKGEVLGMGAGIGKKEKALTWNYAVDQTRQVGSTMKPVSTYGLALYTDMIHWGSYYRDTTYIEIDGTPWPTNYSTDGLLSISGASIPVYYALQKSYNTVPAKLCQDLGVDAVFKFCTENLNMKLDPEDKAYAPLSVGALTWGISIQNLVNAYIPYGNDGTEYEAHIISKVTQANHDFLEIDGDPHEGVDPETAWVMNRLLKNVVENGTGTGARISGIEVCGKTGTTNDWYDSTFVGLMPDFVSGVWIGYDKLIGDASLPLSLHAADIWRNIVYDWVSDPEHVKNTEFTPNEDVIEAYMCSNTGKIAGSGCPHGVIGYWKSSNAPYCDSYSSPSYSDTSYSSGSSSSSSSSNSSSYDDDNNYNYNYSYTSAPTTSSYESYTTTAPSDWEDTPSTIAETDAPVVEPTDIPVVEPTDAPAVEPPPADIPADEPVAEE